MTDVLVRRAYRSIRSGVVIPCTRDEWLKAVLRGAARPKPPEYWLQEQERVEHRSRKAASIAWSKHYPATRKYIIWDQATDADFIAAGYLRE